MPSDQEKQYHRTFLSLHKCLTIYNEDERHQHNPGGVPNRQAKIESDPVFKYHVHSCPRYPQRAPGQPIDRQYSALLARDDGSFEPLEIIPKRGQQFPSVAMEWELQNSVLCSGSGSFSPVVNSWMEVTGHFANVRPEHLIYPKKIYFEDIADYIKNEIPILLWNYQVYDASSNRLKNASHISLPPEWVPFSETGYNGGVSVLLLPNGKVIGARGHRYQSNNGQAIPTVSPLDFWTPGQRLVASAIRGLTNRVGGAVSAGFRFLSGPTKELAELSVARMAGTMAAGKTLPGMAVSTGAFKLPVEHLSRRTLIMGEDLAQFRQWFAQSNPVSGFYDVFMHADSISFQILVKENGKNVWKNVSVREVANAVKPQLAAGDKIRLLACDVGSTGGPAQQLANELNHPVWAPTTKVDAAPANWGTSTRNPAAPTSTFVPAGGGKFKEFVPLRTNVNVVKRAK